MDRGVLQRKIRFVSDNQQILSVDRELTNPINKKVELKSISIF